MAWRWEQLLSSSILRETFCIFTITLLSLLHPLSVLLLARLSNTATYLPNSSLASSFPFSLFLYTSLPLLFAIVSLLSITALVHCLTGRVIFPSDATSSIRQPRLYLSWILLCTLQVCVGLGIESTIAAGIWSAVRPGFDNGKTLLSISSIILFIGLHETMLHWSRTVVRPVVEDTVFGLEREEKWVERVAMAASFGMLWWWRLRDEAEALVIVLEPALKKQLTDVRVAKPFGCCVYYLSVTIGMVRLMRGLIWFANALFREGLHRSPGCSAEDDDKV